MIPTFNGARFIKDAIDSALNQTCRDCEIIVVDDGSTDKTHEVLAQYEDKIRYLRQNHTGVSAARNRGILSSNGQYVAFLDADDIWLPKKLELQTKLLDNNPDVALVYCDAYLMPEKDIPERDIRFWMGRLDTEKWTPKNNLRFSQISRFYSGDVFHQLFLQNFIDMSSTVIRRNCLDRIGLFNTRYTIGEDYDIFLRIARSFKVNYVDEPLSIYRTHPESATHDLEATLKSHITLVNDMLQNDPSLLNQFGSETMDKRYYRFHIYLGNHYLWNGETKDARANYQRYIKLNPKNATAYLLFLSSFLPSRLIYKSRKLARRLGFITVD